MVVLSVTDTIPLSVIPAIGGEMRIAVLALTGVVVCLAGCAREQTETKRLPSTIPADEFVAQFSALGKLGDERLQAARKDLDKYCAKAGARHHTNITFVGCGYDLHEEQWKGHLLTEATCTIGGFKASYAREIDFQLERGAWDAGTARRSSASLNGDPPHEFRKVLEGFGDTLSRHFAKAGGDEEPLREQPVAASRTPLSWR